MQIKKCLIRFQISIPNLVLNFFANTKKIGFKDFDYNKALFIKKNFFISLYK